jgi:hypothetical protein
LFVGQNCISDAVEAVTELVQRLLGVGHCFTCTASKVRYFTYPSPRFVTKLLVADQFI